MNPFFFLLALTALLDIAGTVTAKLWSTGRNPLVLLLTFTLFGAAGFFFARSLRYEGMAIANILWFSLSAIASTLIGFLIFREDIAPLQLAGIAVVITGMVLINLK